MYIMFLGETITNYHAVGVIVLHIFVVNGKISSRNFGKLMKDSSKHLFCFWI